MSPDQQWISTMSMNRFYDHCYLIECAYHIISRYCCSFTNLLNHDDGSIPYYLVQKVKIAVEYGKMLLCTRYRPFQQHLRLLGTYNYIDQLQYESLCVCWNTIKTETQIVEMYFNQISLLIYPVVSSSTLLSLDSAEYSNVPVLTKINALIQSLTGCDEAAVCSSLLKNTGRFLKPGTGSVRCSEEELGLFIVNRIIEPLFDEAEHGNESSSRKIEYTVKQAEDLISYENKSSLAEQDQPVKDAFQSCSFDIVDLLFHRHSNVNQQLHLLQSSNLINDLYYVIGNDIFRIDDKLLGELLAVSCKESPVCTMGAFSSPKQTSCKQYDKNESPRRFDRGDGHARVRYDSYHKRPAFQRKYQKRPFHPERKYSNDGSEMISKKYAEQAPTSRNII